MGGVERLVSNPPLYVLTSHVWVSESSIARRQLDGIIRSLQLIVAVNRGQNLAAYCHLPFLFR